MCLQDKNAGARAAARAEDAKRRFNFVNAANQSYNSEVSYLKGQDQNVIGLSRDRGDAFYKALYTQGKGRQAEETSFKKYATAQFVDEGGSARGAGRNKYLALLDQQSKIEYTIHNTFGRNMDIAEQGIKRKFLNANATNRQKLKGLPQFGPPTMIPPRDYTTSFLQLASFGLNAVSPLQSLNILPGG